MSHNVAVSPPIHPHAHQIYEYQYFGGLQDSFPVLGRGWGHDWDHCPVAAVAMQEVAPGAEPLGQEEHYPQTKGCTAQHAECLDCASLLLEPLPVPTNIGGCSMLSV